MVRVCPARAIKRPPAGWRIRSPPRRAGAHRRAAPAARRRRSAASPGGRWAIPARGRAPVEELLVAPEQLLKARHLRGDHLPVVEPGEGRAHAARDQLQPRLDAEQRVPHLVDQARPEEAGLLQLLLLPVGRDRRIRGGHRRWAPAAAAGSMMVKVAPRPSALSTSSLPWCASTMLWEMERPSPIPEGSSLVVKNGSKIRSRIDWGIPLPVSLTESLSASPFTSLRLTFSVPP